MNEEWADCAVPGCPNKRCARLASQYCYPHSNRPEDGIMKQVDEMCEPALVTAEDSKG